MTLNPILKVLSSIQAHRVRALLVGGQACVFYGAAEFSRDAETRRTTISVGDTAIELMSLPDLVQAKKTQRDKDWPMVRRLVEVNYFANREHPTREQIRFWFLELRTPELLIELMAAQNRLPAVVIRKVRS